MVRSYLERTLPRRILDEMAISSDGQESRTGATGIPPLSPLGGSQSQPPVAEAHDVGTQTGPSMYYGDNSSDEYNDEEFNSFISTLPDDVLNGD